MKTIIVQSVQGKLRNARKEKQTVYLSGSLGMGKTTAVKYFYRNTPHIYLDGSNGKLLQMPGQEMLGDKVLIIDDISQIADTSLPVNPSTRRSLLPMRETQTGQNPGSM